MKQYVPIDKTQMRVTILQKVISILTLSTAEDIAKILLCPSSEYVLDVEY